MSFRGKVVLITGASSGIGRDAAIEFARSGAKVALVDINGSALREVDDEIRGEESLSPPLPITGDVTQAAPRIIEETIRVFGRLDILVNNVGIVWKDTASNVVLETHDRIFATNCRAAVELTKLAIPHLEKTKGNVVNVSSLCGSLAHADMASYCMSKAALDMYTKCASLELAPRGIRVNSVNPGCTLTPLFQTMGKDETEVQAFLQKASERYPVGRIGKVSDMTNAILYLAGEKSSFINGVLFNVDGGRMHV